MHINIEKFKNLIISDFENNLHQCARILDVHPSTVSRIVNGNSSGGAKFLGSLMNYCNSNGLDFSEFIFLPHVLHKANGCGD